MNTHKSRKTMLISAAIAAATMAWGAWAQPTRSQPDLRVSVDATPNPVPPGMGYEVQVTVANVLPPATIDTDGSRGADVPRTDLPPPVDTSPTDGRTERGADVQQAELLLHSTVPSHAPVSIQPQPPLRIDCSPTSVGESTARCKIGPLTKDGSWTITFVYPNPGFAPTGPARIAGSIGYGATIDDIGVINERDEGNNSGNVSVNFEVPRPPPLKLGSAGLRKDSLIDQDTANPQERRARSGDNFILVATATDSETGIRRVSLQGENRIVCTPRDGSQTIDVVDQISETAATPSGSSLPSELAKQFGMDIPTQRGRCPNGTIFRELRLELRAEAENGRGEIRQLAAAIVRSFGPNAVRVATFNMWEPGNHPDAQYVSWGQTLGNVADVLLLQEVPDERRAKLVASAAGMPYVALHADVAIASRASLRNVVRRSFDPPGRLGSNNSYVLAAETDLGHFPHQFIVNHWGIRYNDQLYPADTSSPSRLDAARGVLGLVSQRRGPTFVGGDLNANPPMAEVDLLRSRLRDPFIELGIPACACDKRIDYVLYQGLYAPVRYEDGFTEQLPSDHPIIVVTFEAQ